MEFWRQYLFQLIGKKQYFFFYFFLKSIFFEKKESISHLCQKIVNFISF